MLLALVLAAIVWSRGRSLHDAEVDSNPKAASSKEAADPRQMVSLKIDFGDGREKNFDAVAWQDGMTAANLLHNAPDTDVSAKGAGEAAFLTAIDGVSNEGAGGRNWTYSVNGKTADRSFAIYKLQPGDQVLWRFGPRQ